MKLLALFAIAAIAVAQYRPATIPVNGPASITGPLSIGNMCPSGTPAGSACVSNMIAALNVTSMPIIDLVDYHYDDGSGSTVHDYSGAGNDGTLGGGSVPTWNASPPSLKMTGAGYVTVPTSVNASVRTICDILEWNASKEGTNFPAIIGNSSATSFNLLGTVSSGVGVSEPMTFYNGVSPTISGVGLSGIGSVCLVLGSPEHMYVNGVEVSYVAQGNSTTLPLTGTLQIGGSSGKSFYTSERVFRTVMVSTAWTQTQVQRFHQSALNVLASSGARLVSPTGRVGNQLICVGDSITFGQGAVPSCPSLTPHDTFTATNVGAPGVTMQFLAAGLAAPTAQSFYNPSAARNVAVVWACTNDLFNATATPVQCAGHTANTIHQLRGQGWEVVVVTAIDRGNQSLTQVYNNLVRANWKTWGATALADLGGYPILGGSGANVATGLCPGSVNCFQVDGVHPTTTAQQQVIAPLITAAVDASGSYSGQATLASQPSTGYTTSAIPAITTTTTLTATDDYVRCDSTAGNITINLPTAFGITGKIITMRNIAASNSCVFTPSGGQTIDGGSSKSVSSRSVGAVISNDIAWETYR